MPNFFIFIFGFVMQCQNYRSGIQVNGLINRKEFQDGYDRFLNYRIRYVTKVFTFLDGIIF
jgi:hypothetical protein